MSFPSDSDEPSGLARWWADLTASGWRETALRYASHALLLALIGGAIWAARANWGLADWLSARLSLASPPGSAAPLTGGVVSLGAGGAAEAAALPEIVRFADAHTLIPTRGRSQVETYTVQRGDTLFGIADNYSLKPETVLWGNYATLKDDPHLLIPGQELKILPVDGTYHYVTPGSTLDQIAAFYGVSTQDIADWPGNNLDSPTTALTPDTWLVIPGGRRASQAWVVPQILRSTKVGGGTAASNFGQCPGGYSGAVGGGTFVWPAEAHTLSGYDYSDIHHGLDIRAGTGAPIYATDAGVVVYAGWNDFGYGNLVVIDHGNGWQSVYGHLSQWNVSCGQSVYQGLLIGLAGSTGRSSGAHLHFELRYNGGYVSPWTVLGPK